MEDLKIIFSKINIFKNFSIKFNLKRKKCFMGYKLKKYLNQKDNKFYFEISVS
jgi:hypothetical protein